MLKTIVGIRILQLFDKQLKKNQKSGKNWKFRERLSFENVFKLTLNQFTSSWYYSQKIYITISPKF